MFEKGNTMLLSHNSLLTLKITENMQNDIMLFAKESNKTRSIILREAIESYLAKHKKKQSFAEKAFKFKGSLSLAKDLSTNKKHFEGFGE